jgi:hypothetical protein
VLYAVPGEENVHHPNYSKCKSHKIAVRLRGADHGTRDHPALVDAAIAKLKDDVKADPIIVDIGPVRGTANVTMNDIQIQDDRPRGYRVRKRGVTTRLTEGIVISLTANFNVEETGVFLRNQMVIQSAAGTGRGAFAARGDSGAVIVNDRNEVVGLLVGTDAVGFGFASPIGVVENLLNIRVSAVTPGQAAGSSENQQAGGRDEELRVSVAYPELLTQVVGEALGSDAGAQYLALVQQHYREVEDLIHYNKRVTAIWHHNEGPKLLQELQRFVEVRDEPLPEVINGQPLIESLEKILAAFKKFGSTSLVSDLTKHAPDVLQLIGLSYSDILKTLSAKSNA